jgi:hypothetical protein
MAPLKFEDFLVRHGHPFPSQLIDPGSLLVAFAFNVWIIHETGDLVEVIGTKNFFRLSQDLL